MIDLLGGPQSVIDTTGRQGRSSDGDGCLGFASPHKHGEREKGFTVM